MSGPYTLADLKAKQLKPSDLVWYDGLEDWTPAGNIGSLGITSHNPLTQPVRKRTIKHIFLRLFPAGK